MELTVRRSISSSGILIDLDETLVHTFQDIEKAREFGIFNDPGLRSRSYYIELNDVSTDKGLGYKTKLWGVVRPHVKEFLSFCFSYFRLVGVWSAGKKEYVEAVVELLFRDLYPPDIVYTYDDCQREASGNYTKPLRKMYQRTNIGSLVPQHKLFFLDDRDDVCMHNPSNAITIPPYEPETLEQIRSEEDDSLNILISWFSRPEVRHCDDVRRLQKNIF